MTDTSSAAEATPTTPGADKDPRMAAIHLLARTLWREQLAIPVEAVDAEPAGDAAGKPDRADWKEKRRDYIKLATRLHRRLERQGATLSAPAAKDGEAAADVD